MKARKVVVQMELLTDIGIKELREPKLWSIMQIGIFDVKQIQVNVVKDDKKKK